MTDPPEMPDRPDLVALFARLPLGWSVAQYDGRAYGVTRTTQASGRVQKIYAEELAGNDVVSANLYLGTELRPCEMPAGKVLDFMARAVPSAALGSTA